MPIEFVCPRCRGTLEAADAAAGQTVQCATCQTTLRVPDAPADDVDPPRPRRRRPPRRTGRGPLFWLLVVFLLVGFLTVAACGGAFLLLQPKWQVYQSERGGYAVDLPAAPRADMAELAKAKHPGVHIEGTLLLGRLEEYSVVFTDVVAANRQFLGDDGVLDSAVKGLKADTPGVSIVREVPTTVSGFPAREVVFTHPEGGTYTCRMVVAGDRLYVVTAGGPWTTAPGNDRTRRFLDSFRVTAAKPPAPAKPPVNDD